MYNNGTGASTSAGPSALADSKTSSPAVVTYRHLLSKQTLGPSNPLRAIAHCDIDAAYAQFEMVRLGLPPETPVCCQQWQGLIAISYAARAKGITRHMSVDEAKRKCPELVAVHVATYKEGEDQAGYWPDAKPETHKVSLEPFRRESLKILKVFSESCPTIEKASIDEAYLDFTVPVRDLILERNPHLSNSPANSPLGLDTPLPDPPEIDWEPLGNIVPVLSPKETQEAQARAGEEAKQEQEGSEEDAAATNAPDAPPPSSSQVERPSDPLNAWSDYALSIAAELMQKCRREVLQQLGYTCSAGVARNKILAKLCSAYRKPNAQTILRNDAIPGFLRPLKFTKIRSLGGKLGQLIAAEYDAATVGDLWDVPLREFQSKFGIDNGTWLYNVLRGIEHAEVAAKTDVKSMLSSKNFKPSLRTWDEIIYWLRIIATDLCARLNEARELNPGVWPKTIVLGVRDVHFQNRHRQAAFPVTQNLTIDHILKCGERLMKDYISERKGIGIVTNLQLSFSGLERAEKGQQGIQGFFAGNGDAASARGSPAPAAGTSAKVLGKRKAESSIVDLTLDDDDEEPNTSFGDYPLDQDDEGAHFVSKARSADREDQSTSVKLERKPSDISAISDDDDSDIEIIETEPLGPVYQCPICAAVIGIKPAEVEDLVAARKRVERMHKEWHERHAAENGGKKPKSEADTARKKAKKEKKRKGQQKLKSFFKKA